MSNQQLTDEALALPLAERVRLAQALWQSIEGGSVEIDDLDAAREAIRRDEEISSGVVVARTHEAVMESARRALGCG